MFEKSNIDESLKRNGGKTGKYAGKNKAYYNFFEGYTEYTETGKNGKERIRRIYTGEYYMCDLTLWKDVLRKLFYGIVLVAELYLLISAGREHSVANALIFTVVLQAVCLFLTLKILLAYINLVTNKKLMTVYYYKQSSLIFISYCRAASFVFCGLFLETLLVGYLVNCLIEAPTLLLTSLKYIFASFIMLAASFIENKVKYKRIPSENEIPDNGNEITG